MPETVPAAYPPRPLVTSHSRVRSTSGSAARASDHGIWRINSLVLVVCIVFGVSLMRYAARRDRHAEGPRFSYLAFHAISKISPTIGIAPPTVSIPMLAIIWRSTVLDAPR